MNSFKDCNIGQLHNGSGDNISGGKKTIWDHLCSWYGILSGTVTILAAWAFGWQVWHWWFFGINFPK